MKINNVNDVATHRLCLGCGACFSICPEQKIDLVDIEDDGIRPIWLGGREAGTPECCVDCQLCLEVCPGINTSITGRSLSDCKVDPEIVKKWGPFLELWEGYASNKEIRVKGSSGGLCTALSIFCLEEGFAGGVLHIGSDPNSPLKNRTFRSTTKDELIARTGSRYSPASPCDSLKKIESSHNASVFIGKPCDVAGLRMAQKLRPELAKKTALTIGFFCAGTPSTRGTLDLLKANKVDPSSIEAMRYRGEGWPGMATVHFKQNDRDDLKMTYKESWGFVQKYRPFRCYLCPDLTAEFADISVGDPWYREVDENEPGRSLILIRTERGREIFHQAMEKGYVKAELADPEIIYQSQKNLLGKRQAIWGRLLAMKLLRIPYPKLEGFHLFENWLDLPFKEKVKSILGTAKRIVQRNYFKPLDYSNKNKGSRLHS